MNNPNLIWILILGAALMCLPISIQMRWYKVAAWKSGIISIVLVATGLFGSRLWYYVENQSFLGRSFYGVIFIAPIVFYMVSKIIRIPYGYTLDFIAPGGCLTLALVKIQCLRDGCCNGILLYIDENRNYIFFPSQIVEMIVFLIISILLLIICRKSRKKGNIFPWFMILYGASRFGLDFLRGNVSPYALGLSPGSFWSLIAFSIGVITLIIMRICKKNITCSRCGIE